jgi:hypothetical protein
LPHRLKVLPQLKLSVLRYWGIIDRVDFDEVWVALNAWPGYEPIFDELVMFSHDASFSGIDFDLAKNQADRLIARSGGESADGPKRRAMVTANHMQAVLGRMFLAIVRSSAQANFEIECFEDLEAALAWIESGKGPNRALDRRTVLGAVAALDAEARQDGPARSSARP